MAIRNRNWVPVTGLAAVLGLALCAGHTFAHVDGVSGRSQSATGCSCHGSSPNGNGAVTVTLAGPQAVAPGSTHTYTLSVSGGPAGDTGGFDLHPDAGTITPGAGTYLLGGDLVHADNASRRWTFDWTAPATDGSAAFYAVALASNGSGSSGDSWNFYGGAVNTKFVIQVSSLVGVGPGAGPAFALLPPVPNPTLGGARIAYVLPATGPATVAVYDAVGRRVATLAAGVQLAGPHALAWDGRLERGGAAAPGAYFIRLEMSGRERSVRLLRLR